MMGPKEKKERALGERLGLKGDRAISPKSAMMRKPYRPGVHGPRSRPRTLSEFGLQIREKRKFKLSYGVDEREMKRLFDMAVAAKGASGAKMLEFLERRLDNAVYRLGFAPTRGAARQLISMAISWSIRRRCTRRDIMIRKGDVDRRSRSAPKRKGRLRNGTSSFKKYDPPAWLSLHPEKMEGTVLSPPTAPRCPPSK